MTNSIYKLGGLKFIVTGLLIMGISSSLSNLMDIFKPILLINLVDVVLHGIGWGFVIIGALPLLRYRKEFSLGFIFSCIGLVATIFEIIFIYQFRVAGTLDQVFMSGKTLFMAYVSNIMILCTYFYITKGCSQLLAKYDDIRSAKHIRGIALICLVIILITLVVIPFGHIFEPAITVFVSGGAVFISLLCQFLICGGLNKSYKLIDGRKS